MSRYYTQSKRPPIGRGPPVDRLFELQNRRASRKNKKQAVNQSTEETPTDEFSLSNLCDSTTQVLKIPAESAEPTPSIHTTQPLLLDTESSQSTTQGFEMPNEVPPSQSGYNTMTTDREDLNVVEFDSSDDDSWDSFDESINEMDKTLSVIFFGDHYFRPDALYRLGSTCVDAYYAAVEDCGLDLELFPSVDDVLMGVIYASQDSSSRLYTELSTLPTIAKSAFTLSEQDVHNLGMWRNTMCVCRRPVTDLLHLEAVHSDLPVCALSVARRAYTVLLVTQCKLAGKSLKKVLRSHVPTDDQIVYINSLGLGAYSPVAT